MYVDIIRHMHCSGQFGNSCIKNSEKLERRYKTDQLQFDSGAQGNVVREALGRL